MKKKVIALFFTALIIGLPLYAGGGGERGGSGRSASSNQEALNALLRGVRTEVQRWDEGRVTVYHLDPAIGLDTLTRAVTEAGFMQVYSGNFTRDWELQNGVLRWCVPSFTGDWNGQIQSSAAGETTVYNYGFRSNPIMDGIPWRAVNTPLGNEIERVVYGNGIFIATAPYDLQGDEPGKIAYSRDGVTWTLIDDKVGLSHPGNLVYGAGKFVASSWGNDRRFTMAYSADGMTWRPINDRTLGSQTPFVLRYVGDKFFAIHGGGTRRAYSLDGLTWTLINDPELSQFTDGVQGMAYGINSEGVGRFVAVGGYRNNRGVSSRRIAYSDDGISWTRVADNNTIPLPGDPVTIGSVAYGAGKFVALSNWGGRMAYSTDGVTWTAVSDRDNKIVGEGSTGGGSIIYADGRFLAVCMGKMAYSADGLKWTAVEGRFPDGYYWLYYANGIFFLCGDKNRGRLWYWKP